MNIEYQPSAVHLSVVSSGACGVSEYAHVVGGETLRGRNHTQTNVRFEAVAAGKGLPALPLVPSSSVDMNKKSNSTAGMRVF